MCRRRETARCVQANEPGQTRVVSRPQEVDHEVEPATVDEVAGEEAAAAKVDDGARDGGVGGSHASTTA
jgi:hypothetical protein